MFSRWVCATWTSPRPTSRRSPMSSTSPGHASASPPTSKCSPPRESPTGEPAPPLPPLGAREQGAIRGSGAGNYLPGPAQAGLRRQSGGTVRGSKNTAGKQKIWTAYCAHYDSDFQQMLHILHILWRCLKLDLLVIWRVYISLKHHTVIQVQNSTS